MVIHSLSNAEKRVHLKRRCTIQKLAVDWTGIDPKYISPHLILAGIKCVKNIKFIKGERREKWVAISIDPRRGLGLFVRGKVRKGEILATYKGTRIRIKSNQVPKKVKSGYVFSTKLDDGSIIMIDGANAEMSHGTVGHFINSEVSEDIDESLIPISYTYSEEENCILVTANFDWNSGDKYVELIGSYCATINDFSYWTDKDTYLSLSSKGRAVVSKYTNYVPNLSKREKLIANLSKAYAVKTAKKCRRINSIKNLELGRTCKSV